MQDKGERGPAKEAERSCDDKGYAAFEKMVSSSGAKKKNTNPDDADRGGGKQSAFKGSGRGFSEGWG